MTETHAYDKAAYDRSASMVRVHGILSIVLGGIGILVTLGLLAFMGLASLIDYGTPSSIGTTFWGFFIFLFVLLPHIYFVVAGVYLVRLPHPTVAKTLTIINLVLGVFENWIILVISIISLAMLGDYEQHHHKHKK